MNNSSLIDLYNQVKKEPTPAAKFITDLSKATNRCESTVRMWVTGRREPEINVKQVISFFFGIEIDELFPSHNQSHGEN